MPRPSLVVVLLALAVAACNEGPPGVSKAATPEPRVPAAPPAVQTVTPEYQTRSGVLETSGKVQFDEDRLTRVQAPVTGRVIEVLARAGDVVEPGHRLLIIDSPDLGVAKSDYAKAAADIERADKALRLTRELYDARAIAQKEVREAENDYRKAIAERARAASRLRTLGITDDHFQEGAERADATTRVVVTAPRSGIIVERSVNPGQVVAYGQSDTPLNLFVIADLSSMWVLADVYEPDIPKIRLGQTVTITLPCCPNDRHEGRVTYIADSVDKDTRTVKVRAVVPNRGRALKAEMFVKVKIGTTTSTSLTLPQSAVHRENDQTFVMVERDRGDYERRPVKLGAELDGTVEILAGVTATERVVTTGSILLKNAPK